MVSADEKLIFLFTEIYKIVKGIYADSKTRNKNISLAENSGRQVDTDVTMITNDVSVITEACSKVSRIRLCTP